MFKNQFISGMGIKAPNSVLCLDQYHISYNTIDTRTYGCDTTAIVLKKGSLFLILNGDHRNQLEEITRSAGLQECIDYFIENIHIANKYSEHLTEYCSANLIGQDNLDRIRIACNK